MHNSKLLQQQQINENMKEEWLWNTKTFYAWEFLQKNKKSKKKTICTTYYNIYTCLEFMQF